MKFITREFKKFTKNNGHEPNVAYVKIEWRHEPFDEAEKDALNNVQVIVIDDNDNLITDTHCVPFIADDEVFYYVRNLEELMHLRNSKKHLFMEDFFITDIVGFDYLED